MSNADIKKNNAKTKNTTASIPCLVWVLNFVLYSFSCLLFLFFFIIFLACKRHSLSIAGRCHETILAYLVRMKNQFLKCNLSPQACGANCSSIKKIIERVLSLFSNLLRKAFKKLFFILTIPMLLFSLSYI